MIISTRPQVTRDTCTLGGIYLVFQAVHGKIKLSQSRNIFMFFVNFYVCSLIKSNLLLLFSCLYVKRTVFLKVLYKKRLICDCNSCYNEKGSGG